MKKVFAVFFAVVMVLSLALTAQAAKTYNMKIAHTLGESDDVHQEFLVLKKNLEERSKGRIKVQVFPAASLGSNDEEMGELCNTDTIQMFPCGFFSFQNINKDLAYWGALDVPYLFQADAEYYAFVNSDYGKSLYADVLKRTGNIIPMGAYIRSWHCMATTKKPIRVPADLSGVRMLAASPKIFQETVRAWGGNPTSISWAETFTALQQGTVDGNMRAINLHISSRLYEVEKYFTLVNPFAMVNSTMVSHKWVEALPADLKEIFLACMNEYTENMKKHGEVAQSGSVKKLRELGREIIDPTPEEKKLWIEASKPVFGTMKATFGPKGEEVYAKAQEIIATVRNK
ncbi:TRAP transporter substrate-binding protein [Desulfovibrio sp. OttesenSCG-928-O18]|nr:TRAP transporter substrate-binding protein [Desulfovibrio sp. OttesenSCG-928-O18]